MGERRHRDAAKIDKWLAQKKQPAMISEGNGEGEGGRES